MLDKYLRDIIAKISNSYGENFFNTITLELHNIIQADYTFIARLDIDNYSSKTISLVAKGELADNIEYSLKDTPCADVVGDCICCYPENVCQVFPNDQLLADMDIEAYLGTPLNNSNGEVMGLIVALYEQPITQTCTKR
jgi:GAF domain-containing protein